MDKKETRKKLLKLLNSPEMQSKAVLLGIMKVLIDKKIVTEKETEKYIKDGEKIILDKWMSDPDIENQMKLINLFGFIN